MSRRWARRALALLAAVLLIGVAGIYWLFYDNRAPSSGVFALDMAAVRAESRRISGALPTGIEAEIISEQQVPRIAMQADASWGKVWLARASYRVLTPTGAIIIDTAHDRASALANGAQRYHDDAWARMQAAMRSAALILVTHEHGDHLGGLIASPNLRAELPHAMLNPQQFALSPSAKPQWPPGSRAGYRPLDYRGLLPVAPGVVLIRAPGHTQGSQMIYVRQDSGREFLFLGDVASLADNVTTGHIRSRLVTDFISHDDRDAVMRQTRALQRVAAENPMLVMVPGHDAAVIRAILQLGLMTPGFRAPAAG
jgi:glyoxylase-like metal-dependent hydrolase (beta-lactamase superfamily II)